MTEAPGPDPAPVPDPAPAPDAPRRTLDGTTALVTGASRGIGRALALGLAGAGASLTLTARTPGGVERTAREAGPRALAVTGDAADPADVHRAVSAAREAHGPLDLLIANAGVLSAVGPTWQVDPDAWWREIEVNLRGPALAAAAVLPEMVQRGRGRVVLMSSGFATRPAPHLSAYGASKAALTQLAAALAEELAGSGVTVFAVSPGMVRTDMTSWPQTLTDHRPDLADPAPERFTPVSRVVDLVLDLATGRFDALTGRFLRAGVDRDALARDAAEIAAADRLALRLRP